MKAIIVEILPNSIYKQKTAYNNTTSNNPRTSYLLFLFLLFLTLIPLSLLNDLHLPFVIRNNVVEKKQPSCDVFAGKWVYQNDSSFEPYYTNSTCREIYDQLNCMKFGRPDSDFLRWKWQPDGCELARFDAGLFLENMRNKAMAFVGDSVGRNQMQSLICLLSSVTYPVDQSENYTTDIINNRRWYYTEYNFTLAMMWAPYLVKVRDEASTTGHRSFGNMMQLDLDRPSESWGTQIKDFDYVIVSAGQWFFRPLIFYMDDVPVSCHLCQLDNVTTENTFYGYKMAFRMTFKAILGLENYKGVTFLRTFSPSHFENGEWDKGGNCPRTKPYADDEASLEGYMFEMYMSQMREFRAAEEIAKNKGLEFRLLDTTRAMIMRPDGHPNHYGHSPTAKKSVADCVHWCLPGPIDTWNEFLQEMIINKKMVTYPVDQSEIYTTDIININNRRWYYTEYNFTLAIMWAPYLITVRDEASTTGQRSFGNMMQLDLDRPSESWATQIKYFDYVIVSAGQWFFRPIIFYMDDVPVSCDLCQLDNVTTENTFYGYKMAFRMTFKAILGLENYKGVTFLRTFSPSHFENGEWDKGGNCPRTKPYADDEASLEGYIFEMYMSQMREFRAAEEIAKDKGLEFRLLDTTRAMIMRPDGHPNHYGHSPTAKKSVG